MYFDPTDRSALKQHAKRCMKATSPNIYLVSLLCIALPRAAALVTEGPTLRLMLQAGSFEKALEIYQNGGPSGGFALTLAVTLMNMFLCIVQCGYQLYCLRAAREEDTGSVETLFVCFKQTWRFYLAQLLMALFTMLWTFLFIIPGLIATYAYTQTFYIMLDHPDMSPLQAIRASRQLMRGHKFEYFLLQLSFLGWSFLSLFTFGLLEIWLKPYAEVTYAGYYNALINWRKPAPTAPEAEADPQPEEWWKQ